MSLKTRLTSMSQSLTEMKWAERLRNKSFWVALTSAIILLCQQLGLEIFPENIAEIINTILLIFTILGVVIDPSTPTIFDSEV